MKMVKSLLLCVPVRYIPMISGDGGTVLKPIKGISSGDGGTEIIEGAGLI